MVTVRMRRWQNVLEDGKKNKTCECESPLMTTALGNGGKKTKTKIKQGHSCEPQRSYEYIFWFYFEFPSIIFQKWMIKYNMKQFLHFSEENQRIADSLMHLRPSRSCFPALHGASSVYKSGPNLLISSSTLSRLAFTTQRPFSSQLTDAEDVRAAEQRCEPPGGYLDVPCAVAIRDVQSRLGLAASCITEVRHRRERSRDLATIAGDVEKW